MKSTKSKKSARSGGRGRTMAVAGVATGLAAGAAYMAYKRRRGTAEVGMMDEDTMLELRESDEVSAPEALSQPIGEMARGADEQR